MDGEGLKLNQGQPRDRSGTSAHRTLFLVPARAGSRGIPAKNLRELLGIPLVGWAVRNAVRAARLLPGHCRVVCSTDSPEVAAVAHAWGAEVPFPRPAELATDEAGSIDVALHALSFLAARGEEFDAVALVQPTSPLALPEDLAQAVQMFHEGDDSPVVSVSPCHPPSWSYGLLGGRLRPWSPDLEAVRRQDLDEAVALNGAVFVAAPTWLALRRKFVEAGLTFASVMPAERGVDVDVEADLQLCSALLMAREVGPVALAGRAVGAGAPCMVIAEAGVNHDGDVGLAHRLVDAAAEAGADAVKFQTWVTEKLCRPGARKAAYQQQGSESEDQFAMLKRLELPTSAWPELKQHAEARGLMFLSTPDDLDSARLLCDLGVSALKVGSAELTNRPFLRDLARLGLPLILSTGMGTMLEVALALDAIDSVAISTGRPISVVLLHAVSAYPAPAGELNLRAMTSLRQAFGVPTGLSDHSLGAAAAVLGAGLGMAVLEKHLTLDRGGQGPDHAASADPAQFRGMVRLLREAETMLGSGLKAPTPSEADTRSTVRRVLLYTADLPEGHVLRGQDVVALRSGVPGLPPDEADVLPGRALRRAVGAGAAVSQDDLA